jgi:hypothetical protein
VAERVAGTATTDFGAPDVAASRDSESMAAADLRRSTAILRACWRTLDAAADAAAGRQLRPGPRGGGRSLAKILDHVVESEQAYLTRVSWKVGPGTGPMSDRVHEAVVEALESAVDHGVAPGPRGGKRWTPRYFVRRVAWHTLDHAWEIEDRATGSE